MLLPLLFGILLLAVPAVGQNAFDTENAFPAAPMDLCAVNQGKGGACEPGKSTQPFTEFLQPATWLRITLAGFTGEINFDLRHGDPSALPKVTWREVGRMGDRSIRQLRLHYREGDAGAAGMLIVESAPGHYTALLAWYGEMPHAEIVDARGKLVLEVVKNWGGNIPMLETWAWVSEPKGLLRVNVEDAIREAVNKVGSGYGFYNMGIHWSSLAMHTAVWQGKYPGKVGVGESVDASFRWEGSRLIVAQAKRTTIFDEPPKVLATWPPPE